MEIRVLHPTLQTAGQAAASAASNLRAGGRSEAIGCSVLILQTGDAVGRGRGTV